MSGPQLLLLDLVSTPVERLGFLKAVQRNQDGCQVVHRRGHIRMLGSETLEEQSHPTAMESLRLVQTPV